MKIIIIIFFFSILLVNFSIVNNDKIQNKGYKINKNLVSELFRYANQAGPDIIKIIRIIENSLKFLLLITNRNPIGTKIMKMGIKSQPKNFIVFINPFIRNEIQSENSIFEDSIFEESLISPVDLIILFRIPS